MVPSNCSHNQIRGVSAGSEGTAVATGLAHKSFRWKTRGLGTIVLITEAAQGEGSSQRRRRGRAAVGREILWEGPRASATIVLCFIDVSSMGMLDEGRWVEVSSIGLCFISLCASARVTGVATVGPAKFQDANAALDDNLPAR